ncbi:MAG TPA: hypothetical protein PK598_07280 [Thermoanaerobaculia bacterium]|nr:hypothetical protein [Thermoanaerobaculia bacterium]
MASRAAALLLLALAAAPAATGQVPSPAAGPPFDTAARTPHLVTVTIDTEPARDILTLLSGGDGAPAALRRLKASAPARAALRAEGTNAEDFFGRLVTAATGTPDAILAGFQADASLYRSVLDAAEQSAPTAAPLLAARVASLLPDDPAVTARLVVLPFLGSGGFREMTTVREGDALVFVVELPRLLGDASGRLQPREAFLKMLREAGSAAWRNLFASRVRKPPAWPPAGGADFLTLLSRSVEEGPAALFLIPDEFFPLDPFFAEPVQRAFLRWNQAADRLLDPKEKDASRRQLLEDASRGDFWAQYPNVVGAQMADLLLRKKGRAAYVKALAEGPRAVALLYAEAVKGTKRADFSKTVRKALEEKRP